MISILFIIFKIEIIIASLKFTKYFDNNIYNNIN